MFALTVLVVVCLASTVIASSVLTKPYYDLDDAENLFKDFIAQYGKSYEQNKYLERLEIFKTNLKEINMRNAKHPKTVFKVNQYADLTREEHKKLYTGFKMPNDNSKKLTIPDSWEPAPDALDYRDEHLVTHVKNQLTCGSCYIFSAVGNIEGQYAKKHKKCLALSEGQSLDCLKSGKCDGGIMHEVMQELATKPGLMLDEDYPYIPKKKHCHENTNKTVAHVKGGSVLSIPNEDVLKQKLADIGPLAVALNANDMYWYQGGILDPDSCKGQAPDHGVVLVGYGTDTDGTKFWIIKNSWGLAWGDAGYFRLLRGVDACGMGTSYTATAEVE